MRKHGKTDQNQQQIMHDLRSLGYGVISLAAVGGGVPDILVGAKHRNFLFEVKNGLLAPSERLLTPMQIEFHETWAGQVNVVLHTEQVLRCIEAAK